MATAVSQFIKAQLDDIREKNFGDITGSYTVLGSALTVPPRIIAFTNSSDEEVYISSDGSSDNLRLAANSFKLFDVTANKTRKDGFYFPVGTQFYVKWVGDSGSSGGAWIELVYGA